MDSAYETLLFPAEVEKYGHLGGRPEWGLWLWLNATRVLRHKVGKVCYERFGGDFRPTRGLERFLSGDIETWRVRVSPHFTTYLRNAPAQPSTILVPGAGGYAALVLFRIEAARAGGPADKYRGQAAALARGFQVNSLPSFAEAVA